MTLLDGDGGTRFVVTAPAVADPVLPVVPDGLIVFSRPTRGSIDWRPLRGFGILDGVRAPVPVMGFPPVPATPPRPNVPLLLLFMDTGPNVVRRGFGGRGMVKKQCSRTEVECR